VETAIDRRPVLCPGTTVIVHSYEHEGLKVVAHRSRPASQGDRYPNRRATSLRRWLFRRGVCEVTV